MFTVNVTQDKLDEGEPGNSCACPVALAILQDVPDVEHVQVDDSIQIRFFTGDTVRIHTPEPVAKLISDFDNGVRVSPFSFELHHPDL